MSRLHGLFAITLVLLVPSCGRSTVEPPPIDRELQVRLESWLQEHGRDPVDHVVGLFDDHDVVFLGEQHRVRHDPLLVQSLLGPLHRAGVRTLATEFGRREDQELIDALVTAPQWDETLARTITFNQFATWGYREYVNIYRAAWEVNRALPDGEPRFRVLGINDSPDWSLVRTHADRDDPEVMKRVWGGGGEDLWARVILNAVETGERVLVYCGIHHAFSEYRQPVVVDEAFVRFGGGRAGNHVHDAIGKRAVTVFLHGPWAGAGGYDDDMVHPADGVIDALMLQRSGGPQAVGFDLAGSPFGELSIENAVYRYGYEDFRLARFCDGWIYTMPISQYQGVTPIPGWFNETNLEAARAQMPNPDYRDASIGKLSRAIAQAADIPERWGYLK